MSHKRSFLSLFCAAGIVGALNVGANCQPPTVSQPVVQDVTVGVNAAVCALNHYSTDVASGMAWEAIVTDVVASCGIPVAQAVGLLDAHRSAMVREGYVMNPSKPVGHP